MRRITILTALLLFLPWIGVHAQYLEKYATSVPGIEADKVAIYIEDLRNGEVVLDVNGEEPMIPASTTKLFTAATVFQTSDLDGTYVTDVVASGKIKKKVLEGDLIIKACGDPTIESAYFRKYGGLTDSITVALMRKGIERIAGNIIVESPGWLEEPVPDGWTDEDVIHPYGTGHHAFNYADNRFQLTYSRDGEYTLFPENPAVKVSSANQKPDYNVWRKRGDSEYKVYHRGKNPLTTNLANPRPDESFIASLTKQLADSGIVVDNKKMKKRSKTTLIYSHRSPAVYDILKSLVLRSDNQMAEAMLRYPYNKKSRAEAVAAEMDLWNRAGLNMKDVWLEDGSGLSRNDRITVYAMADLLAWMYDNDPKFVRFMNMLPVAGVSGTLKSFLKDTPLEGMLLAKTGSLNGVQCYAGYAVDALGAPTHIVVIMVNGFKGARSEVKSVLQELLIEKLL